MKKRVVALLVLVLSCNAGHALAAEAVGNAGKPPDTLAGVKERGMLVAGIRDGEPPFGFRDDASGELVGLDVDLARAVAGKLGVDLRVKPVKAGDRIPALLDGSIDLIAAKMAKSPERASLVDFSATYFTANRRILLKKGLVDNNGSLEGRKIAVVGNPRSSKTVSTRFPASISLPFGDYPAAVEALKNGEVDAVAGDGLVLYGLLAALPENEYAVPDGYVVSVQEYALAARKGDKGFLAVVDQTLDDLDRSGEKKRIFDRWLRPKRADRPGDGVRPDGPAGQASGVVVRRASAPGRFVVMAVKGMFRQDSEVSFYRPHGEFVGTGLVRSLYDDEVYVDGSGGSADRIAMGDAVMMNYPDAVAIRDVKDREDFLLGVKASVRDAADIRREEAGREFRNGNEERKAYQEAVTMRKMELDYQYSDRDYYIVPAFSFSTGSPGYIPGSRPLRTNDRPARGGVRVAVPKETASRPNRSIPDAPAARRVYVAPKTGGERGGTAVRPPSAVPSPRGSEARPSARPIVQPVSRPVARPDARPVARPDARPDARPALRVGPTGGIGSHERPKREAPRSENDAPSPPERGTRKAPTGDARPRSAPR
jgi:polar amino acid transport system substrate-binding protein